MPQLHSLVDFVPYSEKGVRNSMINRSSQGFSHGNYADYYINIYICVKLNSYIIIILFGLLGTSLILFCKMLSAAYSALVDILKLMHI